MEYTLSGHGGKKGETPDSHTMREGSPTGSLTSEIGEEGAAMHPLDAVLTGDEIQALRITDEKLQKVYTYISPLIIQFIHKIQICPFPYITGIIDKFIK